MFYKERDGVSSTCVCRWVGVNLFTLTGAMGCVWLLISQGEFLPPFSLPHLAPPTHFLLYLLIFKVWGWCCFQTEQLAKQTIFLFSLHLPQTPQGVRQIWTLCISHPRACRLWDCDMATAEGFTNLLSLMSHLTKEKRAVKQVNPKNTNGRMLLVFCDSKRNIFRFVIVN